MLLDANGAVYKQFQALVVQKDNCQPIYNRKALFFLHVLRSGKKFLIWRCNLLKFYTMQPEYVEKWAQTRLLHIAEQQKMPQDLL